MGLTADDIQNIRKSWKTLVNAVGLETLGIVVLQGLFNQAPETRKVFTQLGVTGGPDKMYSIEELKDIPKVVEHANNLANTIDGLLKILEDTDAAVNALKDLGRVHVIHKVTHKHIDTLGPILLNVICSNLSLPESSPTGVSWGKLYGVIAACMKV